RGARRVERTGAVRARRKAAAQVADGGIPRFSQLPQRRATRALSVFDAGRPRRAAAGCLRHADRIRCRTSAAIRCGRHRFVAVFAPNRRHGAACGSTGDSSHRSDRLRVVAARPRRFGAAVVRGCVAVILPFVAGRTRTRGESDGGDCCTGRPGGFAPPRRARRVALRNRRVLATRHATKRRMSHIIHRNLRAVPPTAVSASGIEIVDRDGRRYIEASGGAAVSCLGHAHPHVLAAMHAQIDRIAYAHTSFFTTDAAEALAETLAADAPRGLDQVYLVSGGSEAMEAALKLARQYFV